MSQEGTLSTSLTSSLPIGTVVSWAGVGTPPTGWAICNGQKVTDVNGSIFTTHDLTGRFLIGAGYSMSPSQNRSTYQVGEYGGEEVHILQTQEMPSHNHGGIPYPWAPYGGGGFSRGGNTIGSTVSAETGGNLPHNNLPPYYALLYICKNWL